MSGSSPTDRLIDNFSGSPMPPVSGDGSLEFTPAPLDPIPAEPISRCMLGPCANYHELASQMDAQQPLDGSKVRLPVFVSRTCYPSPGIEMDLTNPVRDCSRWTPLTGHQASELAQRWESFGRRAPELVKQFEASWQEGAGDDDQR